ncbi:MAG: sigma 54-interacting transcriptional regulator [Phycisphaeraceae bacterium]
MPLFTNPQRRFVDAVAELAYCNPFLPERIGFERQALGDEFQPHGSDWNVYLDVDDVHPNVQRLLERSQQTLDAARQRLRDGLTPGDDEAARYEELVMFTHYHRFRDGFDRLLHPVADGTAPRKATSVKGIYRQFCNEVRQYAVNDVIHANDMSLAHWFACLFQVRRAFFNIFNYIIGVSAPAVRLRAAVWQSIFTHDMRRYRRVLYRHMTDQATLITGPSGTGKELVARAIGLSQYVPLDHDTATFAVDVANAFFPLHLAAMSPTLIESELFGHHRGAFTGAISDRVGWLENCPPTGTVFLDELGELAPQIQVKLLRVIQERTFSRLGETRERRFAGKIIAATNRDIAALMHENQFRPDLYYRLCSDMIVTPSLHERFCDSDRELDTLLTTLARRVVGEEAPQLASEVRQWIDQHLDKHYHWPGNVRELDQCLRNVMIRGHYQPLRDLNAGEASAKDRSDDGARSLANAVYAPSLTADQLLNWYCTIAYSRTGSYQRAAQILDIDRRTLRARVDHDMLGRLHPAKR